MEISYLVKISNYAIKFRATILQSSSYVFHYDFVNYFYFLIHQFMRALHYSYLVYY